MKSSESAKRSGWASYPAELWNQRRPPGHLQDLPFWQHCAETYGSPILDLCCGNGRISIPLAQQGYEVVGVDLNPGFIEVARRRVASVAKNGESLKVSFQVQDIVHLNLERRFRLAVMPDWSFQVLLTQADQLAFLHALHRALLPDGAFAFNLFIPFNRQWGLVEQGGRYVWPPRPDYHHGAPRTYDPVTQIETLVESNVHPTQHRHTALSELQLLFQIAGFEIAVLCGDVDRRPFTGAASDDYTVVAAARYRHWPGGLPRLSTLNRFHIGRGLRPAVALPGCAYAKARTPRLWGVRVSE